MKLRKRMQTERRCRRGIQRRKRPLHLETLEDRRLLAGRDLVVQDAANDAVSRYDGITGALVGQFVQPGSGGLDGPHNPTFGPDGNLYVVSGTTQQILRYNGQTGAFIDSFVDSGEGGFVAASELAFDPAGNLYVASAGPLGVLRFDPNGNFIGSLAGPAQGVQAACGIEIDSAGRLNVWDTLDEEMRRFDPQTGNLIDVFIPTGHVLNGCDFDFGPNGDVFITDATLADVRRFAGGDGSFLGVFSSTGGFPSGITLGPDGNFYVNVTGTTRRFNGTTGAFIDIFVPDKGGFVNFFPSTVGTLLIVKDTVPDDPQDFGFTTTGGLVPASFSLDDDDDSTLARTQIFTNVDPGTYTVTETAVAGFDTTLTCTDPDSGTSVSGATATIDVDAGETITCTFTNTKQGTIVIIKDSVPDDAQDFAFTTGGGLNPAAFSLDDDGDGTLSNTQTFNNVDPGVYTVAETLPVAGFKLTALTCVDPDGDSTTNLTSGTATIDLDPGETITCTFENSRPGSIVIVKDTVPDDAQDFAFTTSGGLNPATFSLDDDSDGTLANTQTFSDVPAGSYTVVEAEVSGFASSVVCVDPDSGSTVSGPSASIDLDPGETVTCTFTNTKLGTIVIVKDTLPDDPQDFNFTTTGGLNPATFTLDDDSDGTLANTQRFENVAPGTYSVGESPITGFSAALACADPDGGSSVSEGTATIDLDPGETVTCTFTNTKLGTIVIVKDTLPDDPQDFAFTTTGGLTPSTFSLDDDSDSTLANSQTFDNVAPGTYTVAETTVPGYETTLVCSDPDDGTTVSGVAATIDVDPGEIISCTFSNTKLGTIIIVKDTVPNDAQDFSFTTSGGLTPANFSLDDDDDSTLSNTQTFVNVSVGTYTVTETLAGAVFSLTSLTCTDPDESSTTDLSSRTATIDVDAGETITCTFQNNKPGSITIIKDTVPDDPQDFAFTASGLSPDAFTLDDDSEGTLPNTRTYSDVAAGTYTVSETPVAGFVTTVSCTDLDEGTSITGSTATIDLDSGEAVSCTFTNTKLGTIVILKDTVPDDPQDFSFTASGLSPATFVLDDDSDDTLVNEQTFENVAPGSYTVTESAVNGFSTELLCSDPDGGTSISSATATIDVDPGETIVCTFTNTKLGRIVIVKDTVPDDPQDFSFTTTGGLTPATFELDDDSDSTLANTQTIDNVSPGTYTVSETPVAGFATTLACTDPDDGTTVSAATATIDVDPGETISCVFTNVKLATIVIVKDTVPNDAQDFAFTTTGGLTPETFNLDDDEDSTLANVQIFDRVAVGTYTVTETLPLAGFLLTNLVCVDPDGGTTTDLTGGTATIDVDAGETITCTFENSKPGTIVIVKDTLPNLPQDFAFTTAGGLTPESFNLDDDDDPTLSNTQTYADVAPGSYTITESLPVAGFVLTSLTCVDPDGGTTINLSSATATIDLDADETVTCTFTNTEVVDFNLAKLSQLMASDGSARDYFGTDVAVSGDTVVVGAPLQGIPGRPGDAAYVFDCADGSCTQTVKLAASDGAPGDQHGRSVAVSGDTIVVGAPFHDDQGSDSGAAYVYKCGTSQPQQAAAKESLALENCTQFSKLLASDGQIADYFGLDVSVFGETLVVGAPGSIVRGSTGAAYVFTCDDTGCTEVAKLTADDAAAGDQFGMSVSVWGQTVVVGAPSDDDAGVSSGGAYVFDCANGTCTQVAKLTAHDGAALDWFGASVDVAVNTVVVGAPNDRADGIHSGSAYVFDCSSGSCTQRDKLTPSDAAKWSRFGGSVAVANDETIVVGAGLSGPPTHSGAAFVYIPEGDAWTQKPRLDGGGDAEAGDLFGSSVDIANDKVVVGVPRDDEKGTNSGSVCVFVRVPIGSKPSSQASSSLDPSRERVELNAAAAWILADGTSRPSNLRQRGLLARPDSDDGKRSWQLVRNVNPFPLADARPRGFASRRLSARVVDEVMHVLSEESEQRHLLLWLQRGVTAEVVRT